MRVLLVSPNRTGRYLNGDDVFTRLLLNHPPRDVDYTHYLQALREGRLSRDAWARAWFASLWMHSRPPAGVSYEWGPLPPWRYRLLGRLLPDRPDEDIQWLCLRAPSEFDLIHSWAYPVRMGKRAPPTILHVGTGNLDVLHNYYGLNAKKVAALTRRDTPLLRALGVLHEQYHTAPAKRVVVASRYAWNLHRAGGVPESQLRLLRIGLDAPVDSKIRAARDRRVFRFTLVGHHFWRKGGRAVLAAFERLHQEYPEARLTIVSAIPPEIEPMKLAGIEWFDSLPREQIYHQIYPATDVLLLPSLAEGYGMAVVEAMGFGIPVIASHIAALPELVREGETGLLVPPDDSEALCRAMRYLIEEPGQAERFGAAGREAFLREHEIGVVMQGLRAIYREALEAVS
ncbi:MAG: glycosyltransferase family 4 protein [Candidatus Sericytochromatia bacterium]|nr:glycosyltransferase family 4 protein [Candidatus Sericytochromatia bacterium]